MTTAIKDKNIVLGVCGGIAAYKSVEILRLLKKQEANVRVVMTENAVEFVLGYQRRRQSEKSYRRRHLDDEIHWHEKSV